VLHREIISSIAVLAIDNTHNRKLNRDAKRPMPPIGGNGDVVAFIRSNSAPWRHWANGENKY
jgi:hypothetical protein